MAEVIFRYINGVLRPITVNKVMAGRSAGVQPRRQVPKQKLALNHYRTAKAFTVPNASCQVCGAQVFYYEHPNGARVLFDELGPPWPKHPCYEAGQVDKSAPSLKTQNKEVAKSQKVKKSPNWKKLGWQPLVYEKDVLLQSGKAIRVQGRTDAFMVRFEIQVTQLQRHGLSQHKVKDLLMLAKVEGAAASVQLHDGVTAIALCGVVTDAKSALKPNRLPLNQKQLKSLTKLDGPVRGYRDKVWHIEILHGKKTIKLKFKDKTFKHLADSLENLESWVSKVGKTGYQSVYIVNKQSLQFVVASIHESHFTEQLADKTVVKEVNVVTNTDIQLLKNVQIEFDTSTTKIVFGKLGNVNLKLSVANKLFRMGELPHCFADGKLQVLLRPVKANEREQNSPVMGNDFWFYVKCAGEETPKNPRGLASKYQPRPRDKIHLQLGETKPREQEKSQVEFTRKRIRVTLKAIDFTNAEQIVIEVMEQQTLHRLRLHSNSERVRERVEYLLLNPAERKVHLVKRSEQSYQLHIDNRFVVMATEAAVFEQTGKRNGEKASFIRNNDSIASIIEGNAHLDSHSLGAALLDAVKYFR